MNVQEKDVLKELSNNHFVNQRVISESTGLSLGAVNKALTSLRKKELVNVNHRITEQAKKILESNKPRQAVILAAGFGMRMVPINTEVPKALLEVNGEPLIERQIKQLNEVGVTRIYVVVGFMKEQFEYLMDKYGVNLVVNPDYATKNNYYSLLKALIKMPLDNTYIVPCDLWCRYNPFSEVELYSWYLMANAGDSDSNYRVNRKREIVPAKDQLGQRLVGISYLLKEELSELNSALQSITDTDSFWEHAFLDFRSSPAIAKMCEDNDVLEINTYEQLRDIDGNSSQLNSEAISIICKTFHTMPDSITGIEVLKKGMTNRSFLFECKGDKYIMRIPGEGTDQLINRINEFNVYKCIKGLGLCDDPVYINPDNGYKITKFLEGVRTCDPLDDADLIKCMHKLKEFHSLNIGVKHFFDIFEQIEFYEYLRGGKNSMYRDYLDTKFKVLSLKRYIESNIDQVCLTHIDAVPDNFLFHSICDEEKLQLTDWEYSGMQDPHVDIAMFCIYSLYDHEQVDKLINMYFEGSCSERIRAKIYCYISVCGLLWSNWCEYKSILGVEFGEYSLRQYRYAKDYYKYALELINTIEGLDYATQS